MGALEGFLARLEKVTGGRGKWLARCPAHDDRDPSLSVGQADDGRVLIHCFAGCTPEDITAAVGIELWDLAPETNKHYRSMMDHVHTKNPRQQNDDMLVELARSSSKRLSQKEKERVIAAVARGGQPNGFVDEVRKQASRPLPSESLTKINSEEDYLAVVTEINWGLNRLDERGRDADK